MDLKVSYNWLKEYVKINKPLKEFVKEFSLKSQSVERVKDVAQGLDGVVVGKMLEIAKHPNADKLNVAKVDIGKDKPLELIFGQVAKLKIGDRLPIAVAPTTLPSGKEIRAIEMRGVVSNGMCCLDSELGLSDQDRITFFPENTKTGTPIVKALGLNDYILDVEVTSNRPDVMSVVGLAREAAAILNIRNSLPKPKPNLKRVNDIPLKVEIKDDALCRRYQAVVMTDVVVGPSPLSMQMRLLQAGLRPINNLVDITNYVRLEYGQPLHVFDYNKLNGGQINVRRARNGEKILALDGKTYSLTASQLVIADEKNSVAIAGVMGGEDSAATPQTKTIVFESANFDPVSVRKTARLLNLHSDASDLFEKNLPPQSTTDGILRAIELAQMIAGGRVASSIIDQGKKKSPEPKIKIGQGDVVRYLGVSISNQQIKKMLTLLGFTVSGSISMTVSVPWWRVTDVKESHDIIEEIARMYGYHNLPSRLPGGQLPDYEQDSELQWEERVKDALCGFGFTEVYNYSLISQQLLEKVKLSPDKAIKLYNPLNSDLEFLRTTLLAQLLQNIADNIHHTNDIAIFELSKTYRPTGPADLPDELPRLTGAIVGDAAHVFFRLKGVLQNLFKKIGLSDYQLTSPDFQSALWDKDVVLHVMHGTELLGRFGIIRREICERFDIDEAVAAFDFDFYRLSQLASTTHTYQPLPEFPSSTRDISMIVDSTVSWQRIIDEVRPASGLIEHIEYLNTFSDQSFGAGKKSIALRLVFRASDRTLTSNEIDLALAAVIKVLVSAFEAKIR